MLDTSYHAIGAEGREERKSSLSLSSFLVAIAVGVCLGFGCVYMTGSNLVAAPAFTATRGAMVPQFTNQRIPDITGNAYSRQQNEAIEKFKETGLRPGRQQRVEEEQGAYKGKSIIADPVELQVKNFDGEVVGSESLSLKVARPETAKGLVHRYLMYARNSMRAGTASTKTRGEVRGGGKKPYNQKKTGNARQGSRRTPLRPGGGVIFGPKPRDFSVDMNQKERRIAMATALQSASQDFVVVENLDGKFDAPKTKGMVEFLSRVGTKPSEEKVLLVVEGQKRNALLSARNVDKLKINKPKSLRIVDVLGADKIVIEKGAFETMKSIFGQSAMGIEPAEEVEAATA
eukprot:CAMPEP_0184487926 /NCGR_PEP_ID=MMETSP0113_2-20130426/10418_1 /TAXON_ID=91329 /ORGANISM="Norrisiella sphaerica, Strain BC52" /LENGTH=344 /DNA_ID=CAMNT_0026870363 /DNA_START=40 /DNA_END=1074 /DNA_ORIENTATION=-